LKLLDNASLTLVGSSFGVLKVGSKRVELLLQIVLDSLAPFVLFI